MTSWHRRACLALLLPLMACVTYVPPTPAALRAGTPIAASRDSTWEAVVSYFAERNIPIRTIEKASGIIVAELLTFNLTNREPVRDAKSGKVRRDPGGDPLMGEAIYADCGRFSYQRLNPTTATFNVRVTGGATRSTVQVNMLYKHATLATARAAPTVYDCASTGKFESDLEQQVRMRAEGAPR